jgi:hypothetical protein
MLARTLSKTHAELMNGMSAREMVWQRAFSELEAEERDRENRRRS